MITLDFQALWKVSGRVLLVSAVILCSCSKTEEDSVVPTSEALT